MSKYYAFNMSDFLYSTMTPVLNLVKTTPIYDYDYREILPSQFTDRFDVYTNTLYVAQS
jgi:hypothetical protein